MRRIKESLGAQKYFNFEGEDRLGTFWIVTYPTSNSIIDDIFFECDVFSFALQIRGGLTGEDIYGIYPYKDKREAQRDAETLLSERA